MAKKCGTVIQFSCTHKLIVLDLNGKSMNLIVQHKVCKDLPNGGLSNECGCICKFILFPCKMYSLHCLLNVRNI